MGEIKMRLNEVVNRKLPDNIEELKQKLDDYKFKKRKIHPDGSVDVTGDVWFTLDQNNEIPFKFGIVRGDFNLSGSDYTSLKGCPTLVTKNFILFKCDKLKSFDYFPKEIKGLTSFSEMKISSFKGLSDTKFGTDLDITKFDNITSLEGLPEDMSETRLEFRFLDNLKSLKGIPKKVKSLLIGIEDLPSLDYLPESAVYLNLMYLAKVTNYLKILTVKNLNRVNILLRNSPDGVDNSTKLTDIINKHIKTGDVIECQEELIEAGLKQYARMK